VGGVPELTSDAIDNDQVPLSQGVSYGPVTLPPHLKINLWACTTRAWSCFRQQPWMAVFATIVFGALIACGALAGQFILGYALVYVEIENPQTYWALFWNAFLGPRRTVSYDVDWFACRMPRPFPFVFLPSANERCILLRGSGLSQTWTH